MNFFKRCTILFLLAAVFVHAAAAYAPFGAAGDDCEGDCCATAQHLMAMAPPATLAPGQCCVIECPPDTETPPVFTLAKPTPQNPAAFLPATTLKPFLLTKRAAVLRTLPRYLPDSSCRYLQTGALLI